VLVGLAQEDDEGLRRVFDILFSGIMISRAGVTGRHENEFGSSASLPRATSITPDLQRSHQSERDKNYSLAYIESGSPYSRENARGCRPSKSRPYRPTRSEPPFVLLKTGWRSAKILTLPASISSLKNFDARSKRFICGFVPRFHALQFIAAVPCALIPREGLRVDVLGHTLDLGVV
jgi:hypothetical protein